MRPALLAVAFAVLGSSCLGWNGAIERHGTMREVLREGRAGPRISLDAAVRSSQTVAVGALAGLAGEVAIVDGEVWVARERGGRVVAEPVVASGLAATLLASADVPSWRRGEVADGIDDLDAFLAACADERGLARHRAWPFVIEGELAEVEAHVLRGACPRAGKSDAGSEPYRRTFERVRGRLVGFYAPQSEGELTHHGESSHVHVVVAGPGEAFVGHVDRVRVAPGAVLRTPRVR